MFAQYLQALHADAEGATSSSDTNAPPIASEEQPLNQNSTSRKVDLESDAAFPALGAGPGLKGTQVKSPLGWGLGSSQRAATAPTAAKTPSTAAPPSVHAYRDTLSLPTNSIHLASSSTVANAAPRKRGEDAQPTTLGEAVQYTSKAFPTVKVDASTSKNMATFHFAGASEKEVLKAKADLLARIVKKVCVTFEQSFCSS